MVDINTVARNIRHHIFVFHFARPFGDRLKFGFTSLAFNKQRRMFLCRHYFLFSKTIHCRLTTTIDELEPPSSLTSDFSSCLALVQIFIYRVRGRGNQPVLFRKGFSFVNRQNMRLTNLSKSFFLSTCSVNNLPSVRPFLSDSEVCCFV